MQPETQKISISIVSHGQTALVDRLLKSLDRHHAGVDFEVILTENISPQYAIENKPGTYELHRIFNSNPRGLAANHNQAFRSSTGDFVCLVNPDVVFVENVFPQLISDIKTGLADIAAPLIVNTSGLVQDSFRTLPTPVTLVKRMIQSTGFTLPDVHQDFIYPDWIAGIILCMHRDTFKKLGGMDEGYYLYFEDVDFCTRARLANYRILVDTRVRAVHEAGRHSRKNLRYFLMHVRSAARFFLSKPYRATRRPPGKPESSS